jgi:hypothetical protein
MVLRLSSNRFRQLVETIRCYRQRHPALSSVHA